MEVRTSRKAGRADEADHLSLANGLAEMRGNAAHVAVGGFETAGMGDLDLLTVASVPTRADDTAVRGGDDRRSCRSRQVHSVVKAHVTQDRVETLSKARRQPAMH